jgi:hypothetical protein
MIGEPENRSKSAKITTDSDTRGPVSVVNTLKTVVNPPVKVAFSRNPWARLRDLQKSTNPDFELLATIRVPNDCAMEILDYLIPGGRKKGWYHHNDTLKSLILNIKNKYLRDYGSLVEFVQTGAELTNNRTVSDQQAVELSEEKPLAPADQNLPTTKSKEPNHINQNSARGSGRFLMYSQWQPRETFKPIVEKVGLLEYLKPALANTVLYWMREDKNHEGDQDHWEQILLKQVQWFAENRPKGQLGGDIGHTGGENRKPGARSVDYPTKPSAPPGGYSASFRMFERTQTQRIDPTVRRKQEQAAKAAWAAITTNTGIKPRPG